MYISIYMFFIYTYMYIHIYIYIYLHKCIYGSISSLLTTETSTTIQLFQNQCVYQHYFKTCCKTNGFSNLVFAHVLNPIGLAPLILRMLKHQWF